MDTAFTSEGLIRLNTLEETDFEEIPIIRQVECLCQHILNENGRLKLTPNGNLPLKVVREMYEVGIRDSYYERHPSKRIREDDVRFVRMARGLYDGYRVMPGLGYKDAGLSVLLFDRVRKERPGETLKDWDYAKAYFDTRPQTLEDRMSVQAYMFRTFQNFMELFGMITTDCRVDREKHESFLLIYPTPLFERMVYIDENVDRMSVKNDDGLDEQSFARV